MLAPEIKLHRAEFPAGDHLLVVMKEEPPEEQEDCEPLSHISKFTFTPVPVKSEDEEEKPQSSQLHRTQRQHMETEPGSDNNSDLDSGENISDKQQTTGPTTHMRIPTGEKPFRCSVCGKEFAQNAQLETHMIIHTGGKPFGCSECGHRYKYQGHLIAHMQAHTGVKPYTCTDCGKRLTTNDSLTTHKRSHTGEKPFCCYECGKSFNRKGSLARHMLVHSGEKPFTCSVCCRRFNRKWHLNRHMLVHEAEKPFSCSECSLRFNSESGLTLHMTFHRGEKPYSFIPGEKRAPWHSQVKIVDCVGAQGAERHQNEADSDRNSEQEIYSQAEIEVKLEDSSGSETEDSEDDWRETGEHHEDVPHRVFCSRSDEIFNSNHSLKIYSHTGEDQESQVIKEEEEEVWIGQAETDEFTPVHVKGEDEEEFHHRQNEQMETEGDDHQRPESDPDNKDNDPEEVSHCCSQCGKTFKHKQSLSMHMMVHTGEKPFCCSECGKTFNRKGSLIRHMLLYRGEKPFSCSVCGKSFSRKWHLTRHVLVHKAEKPFNCSVCSVRFSKESGLTLHMAFHRGEKPYGCSA